jgi:DNA-binding transcriptional LysR family regulator
MNEPFIAVAPKGYVDKTKPVFEQVEALPFVRYSSRQMMGRQIEAHLSRQRINLPNKFEFDSYHAILCMVAAGSGWTMTTSLGYMRARRFHDEVDIFPLPFKELSRSISLIARKGVLDNIPGDIAQQIRPLVTSMLVDPCIEKFPWMKDKLTIQV